MAEKPSWAVSEELSDESCWVSELMVMRSNAGYYIGRACLDKRDDEYPFEEPYSRESGYFKSEEAAQDALAKGFVIRDCVENNFAYATGKLSLTAR